MDFSNCMMIERNVRIETCPMEEYDNRCERLRSYMLEQNIDVIVDVSADVSNMGLWLCGQMRATAFVVSYEDPIYVEFGQAEKLEDGTLVLPDGRPVEPSLNTSLKFVAAIDYPFVFRNAKRIGFLHCGRPDVTPDIPLALRERLIPALEGKETVDVTYDIDRIKSMRSDLEVQLNADTGKMIETVMKAFPSICRRGRLYKDVSDDTQFLLASLGCPGDFMVCQIQVYDANGCQLTNVAAPAPGVRVEEGHLVALLLETNGPSNLYACAARLFSFGGVSKEYQAAWDTGVKATELCGRLLEPGASLAEVTKVVFDFVSRSGYKIPDTRFVQSMGYSCAEAPRATETAPLLAGMPIICHPSIYPKDRPFIRGEGIHILNMFVVAEGGGTRIYDLPDDIVIL